MENLQERLVQCRKDKEVIEKQEKELLEQIQVEKNKVPAIRHGDYGYWFGDKNDLVVWIREDNNLRVMNHCVLCSFIPTDNAKRNFVKVGNLFDNLKNERVN